MERVLFVHASQIATPLGKKARHGKEMNHIELIQDGAIYIEGEKIVQVGTTEEVCRTLGRLDDVEIINLSGKAVVPGFVDSHTHFLFGGYRPDEFLMRLRGAGYMEIMKAGGGIANTVKATRQMSEEQMTALGKQRLADCLEQGVTTMESKSGYGLDLECECRQLSAMKKLQAQQPIDLVTTYLGAHDIAPEYKNNPQAYIQYMKEVVMPLIKKEGLAEFADVFCEEGVYDTAQTEEILRAAQKLGFKLKLHADEIVSIGGAELAAKMGAISADHLLAASEQGISQLAASETVATLLPCTAFCLNKPYADARKMMDSGCAVALASDYNPGSCFTNAIPLLVALGGIPMHMTMEEVLTAITLNGAAAVGLAEDRGSIEAGKLADLVVLQYPDYQFLLYHTGKNIVDSVIKRGRTVYKKQTVGQIK